MKSVAKSISITAALLVLIVIGGCVGWYWMANQLSTLREQRDTEMGNIAALDKKTHSPIVGNLDLLKRIDADLRKLLDDFQDELTTRDKVFDAVRVVSAEGEQRGLDPDAWKKMFGAIRDRLTKAAADAKVKIPQDYDFTFSAYRLSLPPGNLTLPLGIQLLGVEKISDILIGDKVWSIGSIKRAGVESARGGAVGRDNADLLGANVLAGPGNLYKVYPFELNFTCSPAVFSAVVSDLAAADLLFVIRDLVVENEKQAIPLASQVKTATASGNAAEQVNKLVVPVLGQETIRVNMRVDLIYLTLQAPAELSKIGGHPPARQKK
jgi:hypothetical protein